MGTAAGSLGLFKGAVVKGRVGRASNNFTAPTYGLPTPKQYAAAHVMPKGFTGKPAAPNWGAIKNVAALQAYLAAQQGPAAAAAAGGGGFGGGGGGGAPGAVDPLTALGASSSADLQSIAAQQAQRLAELQSQQKESAASTSAGIQGDLASQLAAYHTATDGSARDLTAQGFSAAPVQQQQALDLQRLQDYASRQGDLSKRMDEIQQSSFADHNATNGQTSASYKALLDNNLLQAQIAAASAGGGGGGGGGGGSSSGAVPTAGDAGALADASGAGNPDFLGYALSSYAGGNKGQHAAVNFAKGLNPDLSNVGPAWSKFKQMVLAQRSAGKKTGFSLKGMQHSLVNPLIKNVGKARLAQAKQSRASKVAEARGFPTGG